MNNLNIYEQLQLSYASIRSLVSRKMKIKLAILAIANSASAILDLLAVSLLGLVGALSLQGITSRGPGNRVESVLKVLRLNNLEFQSQVAILAALGATLFITKSIFSMILSKKIYLTLSLFSVNVILKTLRNWPNFYQKDLRVSKEHLAQSASGGASFLVLATLGIPLLIFGDLITVLLLVILLLIVDIKTAVFTVSFFLLVLYTIYLVLKKTSWNSGHIDAKLGIYSRTKLNEFMSMHREISLRNTTETYLEELRNIQNQQAENYATRITLPNNSKYILEVSMIIGALLIAAIQFVINDAIRAIASLAIFLAAATRIGPSMLRIQQSVLQIKSLLGSSENTLKIIELINQDSQLRNFDNEIIDKPVNSKLKFDLDIKSLDFKYSSSINFLFRNLNLSIPQNQAVAIIGPSGSGKSTLGELILGLRNPNNGQVLIGGKPPREIWKVNPGLLSYVPQETYISDASLISNIGLGLNMDEKIKVDAENALRKSALGHWSDSELMENITLGEYGTKLSGGERQRLGLARALLTNPSLILLDEPTSALDSDTEVQVCETIEGLFGKSTLILITHRLFPIRLFPRIIYMDAGNIIADGSIADVREKVPAFDSAIKRNAIEI